jgi:hypothetical protein
MPASPIAGLVQYVGYGILGGGTFIAVVIIASLLQGDMAKAWAAEMRRMRKKSR